jgi:hypothetical protein
LPTRPVSRGMDGLLERFLSPKSSNPGHRRASPGSDNST